MSDPFDINNATLRARLRAIHHKTLNQAVEMGKLRIITNYQTLNRRGCPIYHPWENILPLLGLIMLALLVLLLEGMLFGIGALILAMLIFVTIVRPVLAKRLQDRTVRYMLARVENWERLWHIGGVIIIRADRPSLGCVAPKGNWSAFVYEHLGDCAEKKVSEEEQAAEDRGA